MATWQPGIKIAFPRRHDIPTSLRRFVVSSLCLGIIGAAMPVGARADMLIFNDGSFVEGEITLETSRRVHVKTRFGTRTYRRDEIEEIIPSVDSLDPEAAKEFTDLPPDVREVLNAEAEYALEDYDKALARLRPMQNRDVGKALAIRVDWLTIEIYERLGRWDDVRSRLMDKEARGTPREQIRAEAHLSILDDNPDYNLRYVGEKPARRFIRDEALLERARQPNALAARDIMNLALEEYCYQLLEADELSVKSFADKLDAETTYAACKNLPRTGDVARHLPYIEGLKQAEAALAKAAAILPDYGRAYEMDLVRTELNHLLPILVRLFEELTALSPESLNPAFDSRTGQLTKQGRQQWRDRCDAFLELAQPVDRLLGYMLDRVENYPDSMRELHKALVEIQQRFEHMVRSVRKARSRTHV